MTAYSNVVIMPTLVMKLINFQAYFRLIMRDFLQSCQNSVLVLCNMISDKINIFALSFNSFIAFRTRFLFVEYASIQMV